MKIKFATKGDIEKIFELSTLNFDWTKEGIEGAFKSKNIILKAEENGEVVAFLIASNLIDSYNLFLIAVKEEQRGRGIATKLLEKLEKLAKKQCIDKIWLEVRESNFKAIGLYQKNNYKNIYTRKKYYSNGENAFIFEKKI